MNVEKFAAHYMFSAEGRLVKWPVITIGEGGVILKIETHSDKFSEQPGTHFFSGILLPGFIDVCDDLLVDTIEAGKRFLNRHFRDGTLVLGVPGTLKHDFKERRGFPLIIPQRFSCKECKILPVFQVNANTSLLQRLKQKAGAGSGLLLEALLAYATIDSARVAGFSKLGRLDMGLTPGLLLLQNADLINFKLKPQTTVKWLNVPNFLLNGDVSDL
jgi:hypothetical protein